MEVRQAGFTVTKRGIVFVVVYLLVPLAVLNAAQAETAATSPPNIVVVFIDDMGWADFSCFGNREAQTPEIDRLAEEGVRFEQFYVNSPICSPSRVALSTGHYPQRWRITSYLNHRQSNIARGMAQWLDPAAPMLARILQEAGYATGHFGKWHMGGQRDVDDAPPITAYGFDVSLTNFEGMGPKLLPLVLRPGEQQPGRIWQGAERLGEGYRWMLRAEITSGFVEGALDFVEQAVAAQKPFYINLWPDDVHSPFWPPVDKWADGKRGLYYAVLEEMDRQLGKLFDRIRSDEILRRNTLVLVCSDNGPELGAGSAGPLRGFKTHLFEGGVRSPLIAWAPGLIAPAAHGRVNESSVFSAIDLVPSLLEITGVAAPVNASFDGEALGEVVLGSSDRSRQAPLFFRRPPDRDAFYGVKDLPDLAVRKGRWKLLCEYDGSEVRLYDLMRDEGEMMDVSAQHAGIVTELTQEVLAWHAAMPADHGATFAPARRAFPK